MTASAARSFVSPLVRLDFQRVADAGRGIGDGDRDGELDELPVGQVLPELGVQGLVGRQPNSELLRIFDDQLLELAVLGGILAVAGNVFELGRGKSHPLTEGDVQGDSVLTAVELRGPQIRELT